jgi:hypothetical protein
VKKQAIKKRPQVVVNIGCLLTAYESKGQQQLLSIAHAPHILILHVLIGTRGGICSAENEQNFK